MFTFLLVPFALLRQKGKGLSRQGKPFSSTVFHLRESLFCRIQSAEHFDERKLVHYTKPKFCYSNFESQKYNPSPYVTYDMCSNLNSILLRPKNSKTAPHSSFGFLIRFSPSLICISLLFNKHYDLTVLREFD